MSDDIDRTDEYLELIAEDQRRAAAAANGWTDYIPPPDEPPDDDPYRDRAHDPGDDKSRRRRADDMGTHRPRPVAERRNCTTTRTIARHRTLRRAAIDLSRPRTRRRR